MNTRYSRQTVDTSAGPIAVGEWAADGPTVLAVHGISSTHLLWQWTALAAPNVRFVAPDLRGRGDSVGLPGPYGVGRHRDDVLALMDALGLDSVILAGMSMGGFVATALANAAPGRFREVLLVDGGPPMQPPPARVSSTSDEPLADRLERTERKFARVDDYRRVFCSGVGTLLDPSDPLLTEYLRYDLVGQAPELEVRLAADAVRQDAADIFVSAPVVEWMSSLTMPTTLLHAEWSIGKDSSPAYPKDVVAEWLERVPTLSARLVPGVDHAGIAMSAAGAAEIAVELERMVTA